MEERESHNWTNLKPRNVSNSQKEIEWFYLVAAKFDYKIPNRPEEKIKSELEEFKSRETQFLSTYFNKLMHAGNIGQGELAYFYAQVQESQYVENKFKPAEAFMIIGSKSEQPLNGELEKILTTNKDETIVSRPEEIIPNRYSQAQFERDYVFMKKELLNSPKINEGEQEAQTKNNLLNISRIGESPVAPFQTIFQIQYGSKQIEEAQKKINQNAY